MGSESLVVAVAGGTGFVGGAIARELTARGHKVVVLSHRKTVGDGMPVIGHDFSPALAATLALDAPWAPAWGPSMA